MSGVGVREVWPLLGVRDIHASLGHYRDGLGFEVVGRAEGEAGLFWCRLRRGGASLMLQQPGDPSSLPAAPAGVTLYFLCDDVDALHAELIERGLTLAAPEDAYYAMRQLHLLDPDGYEIVFETPLEGWSG